jgi:hypothetical protein
MKSQIQFRPKKDRYAKKRGGASQLYDIFCKCGKHIVLYQKDGPGRLLRMYLDRILAPEYFVRLENGSLQKKDLPSVQCSKCQIIIGLPMVYEPENRLAFRMVHGTFFKKKSDGLFPPFEH